MPTPETLRKFPLKSTILHTSIQTSVFDPQTWEKVKAGPPATPVRTGLLRCLQPRFFLLHILRSPSIRQELCQEEGTPMTKCNCHPPAAENSPISIFIPCPNNHHFLSFPFTSVSFFQRITVLLHTLPAYALCARDATVALPACLRHVRPSWTAAEAGKQRALCLAPEPASPSGEPPLRS